MEPFTKDAALSTNRNALKTLPYKQIILFACDVARLTLPIWEQQYPKNNRPRTAIETTELFVYGQATKNQLERARDTVHDAATNATNTAYAATNVAIYAANVAIYAANAAFDAAYAVYNATRANPQIQQTIQTIFQQTKQITIPHTPILKAIAHQIRITRNFQEYNILLDNLEEVHNIQLERIIPLGLSHYVLYHLTNTH